METSAMNAFAAERLNNRTGFKHYDNSKSLRSANFNLGFEQLNYITTTQTNSALTATGYGPQLREEQA